MSIFLSNHSLNQLPMSGTFSGRISTITSGYTPFPFGENIEILVAVYLFFHYKACFPRETKPIALGKGFRF
jgi:hypothetical protein